LLAPTVIGWALGATNVGSCFALPHLQPEYLTPSRINPNYRPGDSPEWAIDAKVGVSRELGLRYGRLWRYLSVGRPTTRSAHHHLPYTRHIHLVPAIPTAGSVGRGHCTVIAEAFAAGTELDARGAEEHLIYRTQSLGLLRSLLLHQQLVPPQQQNQFTYLNNHSLCAADIDYNNGPFNISSTLTYGS